MSVWESLKTAWQSIFANKMRSSLTMLGIVIGVCAVVLLVALGTGVPDQHDQDFQRYGGQRPVHIQRTVKDGSRRHAPAHQ